MEGRRIESAETVILRLVGGIGGVVALAIVNYGAPQLYAPNTRDP